MAEKVTIGNCELWHGDCREVLPLLGHDISKAIERLTDAIERNKEKESQK